MSKVRLAIIGNGMVGHRFIEDLLDKSDAANFDITVFCEEPRCNGSIVMSACGSIQMSALW
nr:hypothetical protein [Citrobacter youngae]